MRRRAGHVGRAPLLGAFLGALLTVLTPAHAGHELPIYPSYYPHEIRIQVVDPSSAAALLQDARIHAYLGREPIFAEKVPASVSEVAFLGSYLVLSANPGSRLLASNAGRCDAMETTVRRLAAQEAFVYHPYPVTPYDADYLHHFDLARAAKERYRRAPVRGGDRMNQSLKVEASGRLAERLLGSRRQTAGQRWDLKLEEIDAAELVHSRADGLDGWLGPPWLKQGWFHAYLLLAAGLSDPAARQKADSMLKSLERGKDEEPADRLNLERRLVTLLTRSCDRVVVGYTVGRQYFNSEFSAGVENVAYDSYEGLNSPLFIRTAKLKDFPWNGWLRLGVAARPSAAWNPIGGFTDPTGRLIWSAVGDLAMFPAPYGGSWILNRIGDVQVTTGDQGESHAPDRR